MMKTMALEAFSTFQLQVMHRIFKGDCLLGGDLTPSAQLHVINADPLRACARFDRSKNLFETYNFSDDKLIKLLPIPAGNTKL